MASSTPYIAGPETDAVEGGLPDWREILVIVVERAWLGLAVFIAVFLFFWYNTHRQTPYYRSAATLLVDMHIPQMFSFQEMVSFNTRNLEYFNTHIKALHSRPMMEAAIETGGLAERPGFTPGVKPGPRQAEVALRFVSINPVERSRMINITVEHSDPAIASDLANALAASYIQQDLDNRMSASMQAVEWLRARADEYREKLEVGLSGLQRYRETTQSVSLEEDQNIVIAKLKTLNNALTGAQMERISAETEWTTVQQRIADGVPLVEVATAMNDEALRLAHREWRARESALEVVRQRYRPGHPDYQAAVEEAHMLKQQFERACERAVTALRSQYEMQQERERNLQKALREQEQESFELDRKLVRYNDLKRNVEAEEKVYQAVIARMQEATLTGSLPSDIIRISEAARPASAPFRPNTRQALSRGLAMGLMGGFVAIFGLYFADHRLRRSEEVERSLGLPVLGTLPLIQSKTVKERGLVTHLEDTGEVAEAFRTLRASIMMDPKIRTGKCWMVTSAHAGEGKSLVASNFAISLAQDGERTLLIGADLRRPSLHKLFPGGGSSGLVDVLSGGVDWRTALLPNSVSNLDIITAGRTPSHPSELLSGQSLLAFLSSVRSSYDRIIIDSPPVLGVSDSLVLLSHVDHIMFVVRYAVTHSVSARHALKKIEASGTPCMGAVINGVNLNSVANYYYYRRYGESYNTPYRTKQVEPLQDSA